MDLPTQKMIRDFYFDVLPAQAFEKWLQEDASQENFQNSEQYVELVSLNYNDYQDIEKAKVLLENAYDRELLYKHRAGEIAEALLNSSVPIEEGCSQLAEMRERGAEFIPIVFVGFDSEFKDADRSKAFDMHEAYEQRIKDEAQLLIKTLR